LAFGLAALPAYGQTSQPAQAQQPAQKAPQKAKKVWTNDDLAQLPANAPVSTATAAAAAGEAKEAAAAPGKEKELPPEKDPKVYQAKLEALRKQLADLDAKIKSIQDALSDPIKGTNKINVAQDAPSLPPQDQPPDYQKNRPDNQLFGNEIVRPQDQLAVYEQQRQAIQQQIDELESQARKNGLNPGDIR
jgi:hypothetical protein